MKAASRTLVPPDLATDRRLGKYDERLIRPVFIPALVRLVRRFIRKPARRSSAASR